MAFPGWTPGDFEIFSVPSFEARMELLRARIQPRLDELGRDILPLLEADTGTEWFHHVAKHMRRTVNPPSDTWVAFNQAKRGYKATVHFSAGISALGANVCIVVKPECTEREDFAESLARNAQDVADRFAGETGLFVGDVPNAPLSDLQPAGALAPADWLKQANALRRVKSFEFEAGYRIPSAEACSLGPSLVEAVFERIRTLRRTLRAG
ncbi:MAG TPA: DUF1054 family protein [Armatimonadota bacterium]|jgi:uncharacterized protein YktB (UPF0637 family)